MSKYVKEPWLYEKPWYKPGKWDVANLTFSETVRERMPNLPKKVLPTDTTLREGLEMAGVYFNTEGYVEVAKRLADIGIKETDCGYVWKKEHAEAVKAITDAGIKISKRLIVQPWGSRDWKKQVDDTVKVGGDVIKIQTGTGRMWKTELRDPSYYKLWQTKQIVPRLTEVIKYIKNEYPDIYIQSGFTGTTQADIEALKELSKASVDAGADRISYSDSMGCSTPHALQYMFEETRKVAVNADLQVHCHNDFGMATANTIGAVVGGATSFDCTINGLGDRAGNASLEECCVALELLYGVETGVKLEKLYDLCTWMEKLSGVKMSHTKAITGPGAFLESSELHISSKWIKERLGLTDEWFLPYSPSVVGQTHTAVWAHASLGGDAIRRKLENMGLSFTDKDVEEIIKRCWKILDTKAGTGEAWVTDSEFEKMVKGILKK